MPSVRAFSSSPFRRTPSPTRNAFSRTFSRASWAIASSRSSWRFTGWVMFATCTTTGPFTSGSGAFSPSARRRSKRATSSPLWITEIFEAGTFSSSISIVLIAAAFAITWSARWVSPASSARRALPCQCARSSRPTTTLQPASFAAGTAISVA